MNTESLPPLSSNFEFGDSPWRPNVSYDFQDAAFPSSGPPFRSRSTQSLSPTRLGRQHSANELLEIQEAQQRLLREQTAAFVGALTSLDNEVVTLKGSAEATERIELQMKELKEFVTNLESALRSHGTAQQLANSKLEQFHGRLQAMENGSNGVSSDLQRAVDDDRTKHEARHSLLQDRLQSIESKLSSYVDKHEKHVRLLDSHGEVHARLISNVEAHSEQQHIVSQRLGHLENDAADIARKHSQELGSATRKLEELQSALDAERDRHDSHWNSLEEFRKAHAQLSNMCEAGNTRHESHIARHVSLEQRLQGIEKRLMEAGDERAKQLLAVGADMQDLHVQVAREKNARESKQASLQERVDALEKHRGNSAEEHSLHLHGMHSNMKDLHHKVMTEMNLRSVHQSALEERIKVLEKRAGDSKNQLQDSHRKVLEESQHTQRRLQDFERSLREVHEGLNGAVKGESEARESRHAGLEQRLKRIEKSNDAEIVHEKRLQKLEMSHDAHRQEMQNTLQTLEHIGRLTQEHHNRLSTSSSGTTGSLRSHEERLQRIEKRILNGSTFAEGGGGTGGSGSEEHSPPDAAHSHSGGKLSTGLSAEDTQFFQTVADLVVKDSKDENTFALPPLDRGQGSPQRTLGRVASLPGLRGSPPGGGARGDLSALRR
eukprot:TRINITY_DN5619_c0_g1_i1.p1 TRINITY_DN5619_c0_g1~~TRINITY_DN5619_c0_g1_i1.p1  ORF type:complete len:662 (-),score=132.08 TRINITY_DN5619_c0_g1_i1:55-2040(-)